MLGLHLNNFAFIMSSNIPDFAEDISSYLQHTILCHTAFCKREEEKIILKQNSYYERPQTFSWGISNKSYKNPRLQLYLKTLKQSLLIFENYPYIVSKIQ